MHRIVVNLSPSRHDRKKRAALKKAVEHAMRGIYLARKIYTVKMTFYGNWYKSDGSPTTRDGDSPIIPLLDEIARAGKTNDKYLTRRWEAPRWIQSDRELVVVELW
jgi:hypothetical protein